MQQATFGIIGVGGIAQSQHLPNIARAPHAHLKTVCDVREDALRSAQEKYTVPHATTDFREVLADPEISAVIVATREDMQASLTIEALRSGKHVYVEKPLASTPDEAAQVAAAQIETGKQVAVGFNRRFAPAYLKAREIVQSDGGTFNIHYRISDEYWRWGKNYPPGVRVIHEACHVFDILRWFAASDPVSMYCLSSRADDEVYALQFASGCAATVMCTGYTTMDLPKERIEIVSKRGAVIVEEFVEVRAYGYKQHDWIHRFAGHTHPDREFTTRHLLELGGAEVMAQLRRMAWQQRERCDNPDSPPAPDSRELKEFFAHRAPNWNYMVDKGWLAALDHFAECVLSGATPRNAGANDGLWSTRMSAAAIQSRDSGEVVKF